MPTKLTTQLYVERAREVHGHRYDYSKTKYINADTEVSIICPDHGAFKIKARYHTDFKRKCPSCRTNKNKPYTTETFAIAANEVHKNKYDYSLVDYINCTTWVPIICPDHGVFEQTPASHLSGNGCNGCKIDTFVKRRRLNTSKFIMLAKKKHNNKYDYSRVNYVNCKTPIAIGCPDHGSFYQKPSGHLSGRGCSKCKNCQNSERCRFTNEKFLELARETHGDKYTYFDDYVNMLTLIDIECTIHGIFSQIPAAHIRGTDCPDCRGAKLSKTKTYSNEEFLRRAHKRHGDTYEYPEAYLRADQKLKIKCKKHGEFFQTGHNHLNGQGCPVCKSSRGEKAVKAWLDNLGIPYIRQFTFDIRRIRTSLRYDFYLPEANACIEYDGRQHTIAIDHFGGEEGLKETQRRDRQKDEDCKAVNIMLVRVSHQDFKEGSLESKLQSNIFNVKENDIGIQVWYS